MQRQCKQQKANINTNLKTVVKQNTCVVVRMLWASTISLCSELCCCCSTPTSLCSLAAASSCVNSTTLMQYKKCFLGYFCCTAAEN